MSQITIRVRFRGCLLGLAAIAGAYYGVEAIPAEWRKRLSMAAETRSMADSLYDHAAQSLPARLHDGRAP